MALRAGGVRYLLDGAFRWMATHEWGDPLAPPVICVHGLTRNGRDFDALAVALAEHFHVICPDLPGRGASDWLPDPKRYEPTIYVLALSHLLARIGRPVRWVGTSLGGICGMLTAACEQAPITRMVLNDIGPHVPAPALERIAAYLSEQPDFATLAQLEAHLRRVHAPFGPLSDGQWAHLARNSARTTAAGRVTTHYDPRIGDAYVPGAARDIDLWPIWSRISVPILAVRGVHSDILTAETLARMRADGAEYVLVPHAGHAPALMDAPTIEAVVRFLEA